VLQQYGALDRWRLLRGRDRSGADDCKSCGGSDNNGAAN
jgi:hypothetical protein